MVKLIGLIGGLAGLYLIWSVNVVAGASTTLVISALIDATSSTSCSCSKKDSDEIKDNYYKLRYLQIMDDK